MTILVLPYKAASKSAKALSSAMGVRRMRVEGSRLKDGPSLSIINWGNSTTPLDSFKEATVYNRGVRIASNKLAFFNKVFDFGVDEGQTVNLPPYTTEKDVAQRWLEEGHLVVARMSLTGHSGEGIVLVGEEDEDVSLPDAPLYTQYVKKQDEYRVHVFKQYDGTPVVVDVQRKARRIGEENPNWKIRNHSNGFNFVREGVNPPEQVMEQAKRALKACGLDFGAVDVIYNASKKKAYVLEVNTACGLEGTTLEVYKQALRQLTSKRKIAPWTFQEKVATTAPSSPVRVGDTVRVVSQTHGWASVRPGDVGEVVGEFEADDGCLVFEVNFPNHHRWSGREECFERVEEEPRTTADRPFRVGDRVRATTAPGGTLPYHL